MILSQRIKEEREKKSWSQNDLALKLNVSRQSISKWENGSASPDIDRLIEISDLFDITLDSLIRGNDQLHNNIDHHTDHKHHYDMSFWYFLSRYWWILIVLLGVIGSVVPKIINAFK